MHHLARRAHFAGAGQRRGDARLRVAVETREIRRGHLQADARSPGKDMGQVAQPHVDRARRAIDPLVSAELPLDQAPEALRLLGSRGTTGKVVLLPG